MFRCLFLFVLLLSSLTAHALAADSLPNIVFIMVDDMGYGDPGCYNAESKIPTPNIDSLAAEGMRFTDAHAPGPLCHMSRYGLLTGRYPFRTNVGRWPKFALIEPDQMTIASLLSESGYRTAMVGKWHLGFNENGYENPLPGGPVDVGFDSYFGIRASTDIPPYFYIAGDRAVQPPTDRIEARNSEGWTKIQGEFWRAGGIAPDLNLKDVLPRFTDEAIEVVNEHAKANTEQPLFLYLAYPAPHTPWLPSEDFRGKSGASMYGDFAMMVDSMIGRVLASLNKNGLSDNTLVIFTSDNGPVWYEQDVERFGHDSSGGLRGMKADAWECGHRMPFIAKWAGKIPAGSTSDQLLCFTDMLATFAAVVDKELPEGAGPDSVNLLPAMLNEAKEPLRESLAMRSGGGMMTIRKGPWKLIDGLGSGGFSQPKRVRRGPGDPAGQLFHLGNDLAETKNLYDEKPDIVAELKELLDAAKNESVR
ncbi:MAG: arylsulfatase [Planctomycetota bacterium]